jgi:hypothetical protein
VTARAARKVAARITREQAKAWPELLTPVPESEWPRKRPGREHPIALWRSRHYLAQLYEAPWLADVRVLRLSINRVTLSTRGGWDENIPWQDLMRCKREAGYGEWYAVEIYPRDFDEVNVANMRHLWLLSEPLPIGWFATDPRPGI